MIKPRVVIRSIAIVEILIGIGIVVVSLSAPLNRPMSVYVFVFVTSAVSVLIGTGLFYYKNWARRILIFFAGYVIATKFLLATQLVVFTGNTINFLTNGQKDGLSLLYHCCILTVFNLPVIKKALDRS